MMDKIHDRVHVLAPYLLLVVGGGGGGGDKVLELKSLVQKQCKARLFFINWFTTKPT